MSKNVQEKPASLRRHHAQRIRKRVLDYYMGWLKEEPKRLGFVAQTRKLCSCSMCGNPRKYFGEKTIQEKKADIDCIEQLNECESLHKTAKDSE